MEGCNVATKFDRENHRKLWLLMKNNIEAWISSRYIPTFYDAETTVDDLKALLFENSDMGDDYKDGKRPPLFYCYACQYGWDVLRGLNEFAEKKGRCNYCPLTGWQAETCFLRVQVGGAIQEGLFHQLCVAVENKNIELAKQLCETIAGLELREGVDVGTAAAGGGGFIGDIDVFPVMKNTSTTIEREDAMFKLPICVFVFDKDKQQYINSEGLLQVGYREQSVTIDNEWHQDMNYIIIDTIQTRQNSPALRAIAPGRSTRVDRHNHLTVLPITILAEDAYNTSKTYGQYVTHEPYLTVAHDDEGYTLYNDTNEVIAYYVMSSPIPSKMITQLVGPNSSKVIPQVNALKKRPPIVLVQDLDDTSRTYGKFISSVGYITVGLSENTITLYNDTDISLNCKLFFVESEYVDQEIVGNET